jgi:hypothetical protein
VLLRQKYYEINQSQKLSCKRYTLYMEKRYKIVVYVPETHADQLREAMGNAGAGKIGNYSHCTFTIKGTGRFKPEEGANPTQGEIGKLELVEEERIETVCAGDCLAVVLKAINDVHPYEEPATDVYPIEII